MRWKLRVPVDQFESLVQKVVGLGELVQNSRTSQDVTEQFYDIEARIKNKKAEEKSLTKILDERTGKLEDVLKIETELSRVRGEIEQLEGKIRVLENLSSLATLTLNVREREKFEPPPPTVADFPTQVARTWEKSLHGLIDLGKSIVLWAVAWVLWIPHLDRGGTGRLDDPPLALAALAPADRPGQHAHHAAAVRPMQEALTVRGPCRRSLDCRPHASRRSTSGKSLAKSRWLGQASRAASRSAPDQSRASADRS